MPRIPVLLIPLAAAALAADPLPVTFSFPDTEDTLAVGDGESLFELSDRYDRHAADQMQIASRDFAHVSRVDKDQRTVLTFSHPPERWGGPLKVTVTLTRADREVLARLELENDGPRAVARVRFPIVVFDGLRHFDRLVLPTDTGELIQNPAAIIGSRYGGEIVFRYPAKLAMQFATLYSERRSVYFSAYSTDDSFFDLRVRKHQGLRFSIDWYPFLGRGAWASPECGFGVLEGDWHAAADLYRSHMGPVFRPPAGPAWLRATFHGWMQISAKGGNNPPKCPYKDLPAQWDLAHALGFDTLHVFSWHRGGMDAFYPDYDPSPYLGPPEDLRTAMDAIRKRGGHVTLYTNGRLIDPDSNFVRHGDGETAYALLADGSPQLEHYTGRDFRVACPMAPNYRAQLAGVFQRLIGDYHAPGAQIDQLSCNPAAVCFATAAHGHSTPANGFVPGLEGLLRELRAHYREADPDFFVWSEGCNERLGRYYDVHQSHGEGHEWTSDLCLPELFQYVYPDFLVVGSCGDIDALCTTFGQGKPFDIHESRQRDAEFVALLKDLIAVRKAEPGYFLRGRFSDTVGLAVAGEGVRYWGLQRAGERQGTLVNLWSQGTPRDASAEASLRHPRAGWTTRPVYPPDLRVAEDGTWLELSWSGPMASVAFEPAQ